MNIRNLILFAVLALGIVAFAALAISDACALDPSLVFKLIRIGEVLMAAASLLILAVLLLDIIFSDASETSSQNGPVHLSGDPCGDSGHAAARGSAVGPDGPRTAMRDGQPS